MARAAAAALLALLLGCAVAMVMLGADREGRKEDTLLARSSPPSLPPSGSAYRATMRSARKADLYRQAAFDDAVADQDKKVERDEELALKIELVDKEKSREREVKTLLDIAKARDEAANAADEQLERRAAKLERSSVREGTETHENSVGRKMVPAIQPGKQDATDAAASVKVMAAQAYDAYQDDLKAAEKMDRKRQESFNDAKKKEELEDRQDDDKHEKQLAMGRKERKLWWFALKREEREDSKRRAQWKENLLKAEKMMEKPNEQQHKKEQVDGMSAAGRSSRAEEEGAGSRVHQQTGQLHVV
eukprot:191469-Hanusia_phi.AAC.1